MSRKIRNDCFIFNGRRQLCVLCEIMMMMMMMMMMPWIHAVCCLFVVIDFVRCDECEQGLFGAVSEKRFFQVPPCTYLSYRSESTVVLREVFCTVHVLASSELACRLLPAYQYVDSSLYTVVNSNITASTVGRNIMHGEKYNRDS